MDDVQNVAIRCLAAPEKQVAEIDFPPSDDTLRLTGLEWSFAKKFQRDVLLNHYVPRGFP